MAATSEATRRAEVALDFFISIGIGRWIGERDALSDSEALLQAADRTQDYAAVRLYE